jgi:hypothetical protein
MARNLGRFIEKYHRVGDQHLTIDSNAVEIAAMQKQLLISIPGDALLDLEQRNKGWSTVCGSCPEVGHARGVGCVHFRRCNSIRSVLIILRRRLIPSKAADQTTNQTQ